MNTHSAHKQPRRPILAEFPVAAPDGIQVSDGQFEDVVKRALFAIGGAMLFKMRIGRGVECQHVAAGLIGAGADRQFLVLSLPVSGGKLRVEAASISKLPIARIAAAYAGLGEAFAA